MKMMMIALAWLLAVSPIAVDPVTSPPPNGPRADRARPAVVRLDQIDEDALQRAEVLLAAGGRWDGPIDGRRTLALARALRAFAASEGLALPRRDDALPGAMFERLGCAREVFLGWGGSGPRAPELTPAQIGRLEWGLAARGFITRPPRTSVTRETLDALRTFQKTFGYRPQRSEVIDRIWLFRLGVAGEDSVPRPDGEMAR